MHFLVGFDLPIQERPNFFEAWSLWECYAEYPAYNWKACNNVISRLIGETYLSSNSSLLLKLFEIFLISRNIRYKKDFLSVWLG